jgi:hypothetical protein
MKKYLLITRLLSLFLLCLTITAAAQNTSAGNGRIPFNHQKVKTPEFITPGDYFAPGDTAYGYEAVSGSTFVWTGSGFTFLAPWSPPTSASGAVRGGDWNYYIIDGGPPGSLWIIDPNTGYVNEVGAIQGLGSGVSINGIAYDQVNNSYYICGGVSGQSNNLYKLDINTLAATLVLNFPSPGGIMIAIAIDSSGVGYGYNIEDDYAYTFDPVAGTSLPLGPIGFDAAYGQDMDIEQVSGTILLVAFNFTTFTDQIRIMDPVTGATTLIMDLGYLQVAAIAFNNYYNFVPVEMTSFTANVNRGNVVLKWSTATETNNKGFEVQRSRNEWEDIGYVAGYGTTTEPRSYSFRDDNISSGLYSYRLKQIDFDGSFKYSKEVEVQVNAPAKFALDQNYPNPFNPTTQIEYSIPEDGNVSLKVFNSLGQEVADLVNGMVKVGTHRVSFNAESTGVELSSGVYYYRLELNGNVLVKKMLLMK